MNPQYRGIPMSQLDKDVRKQRVMEYGQKVKIKEEAEM